MAKDMKNYEYSGGAIAGGNDVLSNGMRANSCCAELYRNGDDFRVYFVSILHQNTPKNVRQDRIVEVGNFPKLLLEISPENDTDRTLIGFVFEKEEWVNSQYLKAIETMKEYMGFDDEGVLICIDDINDIIDQSDAE